MIVHKPRKRTADKSSYKRLTDYITRDFNLTKIDSYRITNCHSSDHEDALKEIHAVQLKNTRTTQDKTYHLVVSFPTGEEPNPKQLEEIEQALCQSIGYGEHQRISAVHNDTDHFHFHVAINRIHPETFKMMNMKNDFHLLNEKAAELEIRYGLKQVCGLDKSGNEVIRERLKPNQEIESHTGTQSFKSWLKSQKDELLPQLQQASTWQELHQTLAQFDLTIRKRGAGLTLSSRTQKAYTKASDLDRSLSIKKLEDKLGTYQEPTDTIKTTSPVLQYQPTPKHPPETNQLWEDFNQQKQIKTIRLAEIKTARLTDYAKLDNDYKQRREAVKKDRLLTGKQKREVYKKLKTTYRLAKIDKAIHYQHQSQVVYQQYPARNWQDFLIQSAVNGDKSALDTLKKSKKPITNTERFAFWGEQEKEGMHLIKNLSPNVQSNGDVLYNLQGTQIRDTGERLKINVEKEIGIITVLRLAREKYGDTLDVQGDDRFKAAVVKIAVEAGMKIKFQDKNMEQSRQLLQQAAEASIQPNIEKPNIKKMSAQNNKKGIER